MGRQLSQVPEALLARLWQERAERQREMRTLDGRRVRVLYAGRQSSAAGPDFRDALVQVSGEGRLTGDVEIHRRQRDWEVHGHHRDPNYNCVVLHAALATDAAQTVLASGGAAPVVSLEPLAARPAPSSPVPDPWRLLKRHGYRKPSDSPGLARLLELAGDQRFAWKSRAFARRLDTEDPDQVLYEALMKALGYSRNQEQFLELARRLPYHSLRSLGRGYGRAACRRLLAHVLTQAGDDVKWQTFRVRPCNHPRQRLLGAAHLLARYEGQGLAAGLSTLVLDGVWKALVSGLEACDEQGAALVGPGRAADMAVNVVLPFCHARGMGCGDRRVQKAAFHLYRTAPRLQENELTREARRLLLPPGDVQSVKGVRAQQGLIHLYRLLTETYR